MKQFENVKMGDVKMGGFGNVKMWGCENLKITAVRLKNVEFIGRLVFMTSLRDLWQRGLLFVLPVSGP
jgi:hypothetical protein